MPCDRLLKKGEPHAAIEELLRTQTTLYKLAALALFDDGERAGDVMRRLNRFGAWAGDAWIVFWTDGAAIYAQRIGTDGSLLGDAVTIETSLDPNLRLPWTASVGVGTNGDSIIVSTGGSRYPSRTVMMSRDLRSRSPIDIEGGRLAGQALEMDDVQVDAVARGERSPARRHVARDLGPAEDDAKRLQ